MALTGQTTCSGNKQPFWRKGAFGQQPRALEGFVWPGPSLLFVSLGWVQPHRGSCFTLITPQALLSVCLSFPPQGFQPDSLNRNSSGVC